MKNTFTLLLCFASTLSSKGLLFGLKRLAIVFGLSESYMLFQYGNRKRLTKKVREQHLNGLSV